MIHTPFGAHRFRGEPGPLSSSPAYRRVSLYSSHPNWRTRRSAAEVDTTEQMKDQSMQTTSRHCGSAPRRKRGLPQAGQHSTSCTPLSEYSRSCMHHAIGPVQPQLQHDVVLSGAWRTCILLVIGTPSAEDGGHDPHPSRSAAASNRARAPPGSSSSGAGASRTPKAEAHPGSGRAPSPVGLPLRRPNHSSLSLPCQKTHDAHWSGREASGSI